MMTLMHRRKVWMMIFHFNPKLFHSIKKATIGSFFLYIQFTSLSSSIPNFSFISSMIFVLKS